MKDIEARERQLTISMANAKIAQQELPPVRLAADLPAVASLMIDRAVGKLLLFKCLHYEVTVNVWRYNCFSEQYHRLN